MIISTGQRNRHMQGQPAGSKHKHSADRSAHIWNRIATRYAAKPVADEASYIRKLALTREHLHPQASILEFGCGTGSTALALAPFAQQISAFDFSSRMIEIARAKATTAGIKNVAFFCEPVADAEYQCQSHDVVLMHSLLHLLTDWRESVALAHSALKPGGVFITTTVCLQENAAFLRYVAPLGQWAGLLPQLAFFTRKELEKSMVDEGFDIVHNWLPSPKAGLFLIARKPT